ncbi:MAG: hypothetical protein HY958_11020 [Bacteroidia bacterium]|nr:hypothetical protein [Bacteroidia bacterium]
MDTGAKKNVANFETLIAHCISQGAAYAPSRLALQLPALNTLHTTAKDSISSDAPTSVDSAYAIWQKATNEREIVFKPLKTLATRVINSLASADATEQTIKDARTIVRKIEGARAPKSKKALDAFIDSTHKTTSAAVTEPAGSEHGRTVEVAEEHKFISTSQQSFDLLVEHFTKLIALVAAEPLYTPNEPDLKIVALKAFLTSMESSNTAVINAATALEDARIARDKILNTDKTGLCDIALAVKKYFKSAFGATSPQYKQISGLKFKKIKK